MATSGLIVIAKSKEVHKLLQRQFSERKVKKRYVAVLEGIPTAKSGIITLPLCPNPLDRPWQMVDHEVGKEAVTRYEVTEIKGTRARVNLYPQTGRTHQLRMHCAHKDGLACPIVGDELYGTKAERLHLHAAEITFTHPLTGKEIHIVEEPEF
jgi:tRNA pseudouridine32 synthase/23S rRNA pseudouridine746 synthase